MDIPVDEKALWLAVLIQSTADLVGINLPKNKLRENIWVRGAREWFEGDGDEIGGFVWTCQIIGIDAPTYRRRLYKIAIETPEKLRDMRLHEWNAGENGWQTHRPRRGFRRISAIGEKRLRARVLVEAESTGARAFTGYWCGGWETRAESNYNLS